MTGMDWLSFIMQQREPDLWCGRDFTTPKALQLLLYSTGLALMKYQNFISQFPSYFRGQEMGKALHNRQLPENIDIFGWLIFE